MRLTKATAVALAALATAVTLPGTASAGSVVQFTTTVRMATGQECTLTVAGSVDLNEWSARPLPWDQTVRWRSGILCVDAWDVREIRTDSNVFVHDASGLVWQQGQDVSCTWSPSCDAIGRYDEAWRLPGMAYHVVARYSIRSDGGAWTDYPRGSYRDGFACEINAADSRYLLCYAEAYGDF